MISRVVGILLVVFAASTAQAQAPAPVNKQPQTRTMESEGPQGPEKDKAIRNLLKLMGAANLSDQMLEGLMPQIRSLVASAVPEDGRQEFMESFSQKLRARLSAGDIVNAVASIYASHFSLEEIQDLTRFYGSPLGQRLVAELPQIMKESQATGAQIGRRAFLQALRDMSNDYPDLKKLLPPDEAISNDAGAVAPRANPK